MHDFARALVFCRMPVCMCVQSHAHMCVYIKCKR